MPAGRPRLKNRYSANLMMNEHSSDIVDDLKKASEDGKLSKNDIAFVTEKLLERTKQKMSAAAYNLLTAAAVDINALIIGAGKEAVEAMKKPAA